MKMDSWVPTSIQIMSDYHILLLCLLVKRNCNLIKDKRVCTSTRFLAICTVTLGHTKRRKFQAVPTYFFLGTYTLCAVNLLEIDTRVLLELSRSQAMMPEPKLSQKKLWCSDYN